MAKATRPRNAAKAVKAKKTKKAKKAAKPAKSSKPKSKTKRSSISKKLGRFYKLVAQNNPASLMMAEKILIVTGYNPVTAAEQAYLLVHKWRNGVVPDMSECVSNFGTGDLFECAHAWADLSIKLSTDAGKKAPYGYWAKAYVYKYQRKATVSAMYYQLAALYKAAWPNNGRPFKHFALDWVESQVYWLSQGDLAALVEVIEDNKPSSAAERWLNWVAAFAYHMMGEYQDSLDLFPNLPNDEDTSLLMAANCFRLGKDADRIAHKKRFFDKQSNVGWDADKEDQASPFIEDVSRQFWYGSVVGGLA